MASLADLPSILFFGPQTEFPSQEVLTDFREELVASPILASLRSAIDDLPNFWQTLITHDPKLGTVPGPEYLNDLKQWIANGGAFPHHSETSPPNVYALPVAVILQITQYVRYLVHLKANDAHQQILSALQKGGIQGFCVGFLSAAAVSTSASLEQLDKAATVSLRLAVCIGAHVDRDELYSENPNPSGAIAVRWREGNATGKSEINEILQAYSEAFVSSFNDSACVTVTARRSDLSSLTEKFQDSGFRVKPVQVHGRFHTNLHNSAVESLSGLLSDDRLLFFDVGKLHIPLRSTVSGKVIEDGSLSCHALENILLKPADWYTTVDLALGQIGNSKVAAFAGFGNHLPPSLVQSSNLRVLALSDLRSSRTNGQSVIDSPFDTSEYPAHSIAIVGMAGRFPGADSVEELWDLLLEGKVMAEPAPTEKFKLPTTGDYANTKWWGNFLRDSDAFDHRFFKKSSREAVAWDPQQRIMLEVVYEALENAGYFGAGSNTQPDDYGCYIGAVMNNYYDNVSCHPATAYATLGTSRCFLSGCMSHYFGWTGPSLTIDTACSSSLVAINTACRAIWSGECSRAIAGGTNVICSPFDYLNLGAAGFLSPTGQCKPFDAGADGYCRGEGVAAVVLKPLADAIKENDNILGVIVGSAANQNHNFSHVTVPHSGSQVNLYQKVMKLGNLEPGSVTYVEAHGTGTGVGDPVEVRSIREAFGGPDRDSILHFGSIKGNIGHTEATAGIAGLVKVLMMMQHGKIPAQASHKTWNPKIPGVECDKMALPRSVLPWNPKGYRTALVNSYGAAGSNSAVMLRENPRRLAKTATIQLSKYPLFISAGSTNSLSAYSKKLLDWINQRKLQGRETGITDLTFNLADRTNHGLNYLLATSVMDLTDLEKKLELAASGAGFHATLNPTPVVLVFGGQESDFIGLSEEVYRSSALLRKHLDDCDATVLSLGLESFYPAIFQPNPIANLVTLHTSLFAIQYATAKAWIDSGLTVDAVVGHSFGQLTAFCISGALSLLDALKLVSGRASIMLTHWGPETGSMIFLQADRLTTSSLLASLKSQQPEEYAEIACYNGPKSHVIVGSSKAINALEKLASSYPETMRTKKLKVTHGFHSKFTENLLGELTALARDLTWRRPNIHLETCDELQSVAEPDFKIVGKHTRQPVYFQHAVERLSQKFPQATWLEAGRGSSVIQLARGSIPDGAGHNFLSPQLTSASAQGSLADVTIDLWKAGYAAQFWPFHRSEKPHYEYLSLPPYQFEKTRHWLGFLGRTGEPETTSEPVEKVTVSHELLTFLKFKDSSNKEAIFNLDPHADRFKSMLNGHVMAGQTLAPASLYFEVVARAALYLQSDTEAITYVPTVHDLLMKSPIGQDTSKAIILTLKRTTEAQPSWSFSITTQETSDAGSPNGTPFEVSNGTVYLTRRDDPLAAQRFRRFETLTGHKRYEEIVSHPDAEKMQGNHIYRAFNHIVHYAENFRGIKQVACVCMEAAGKVCMYPDPKDPTDQRLVDTPMTDSFMQFAGFLVNYFNNPSLEEVLVCMKIEHIEIGGDFSPDAKEWIVYSNMTEGGETDASSDAYVFEAESKKMVMAAFGFRFSKMSQALLARMLKSVNRIGAAENAEKISARATEKQVIDMSDVVSRVASKSASKRMELLQVLSSVTDVPVEELTDEWTLDELGIDSLMATEVLNDIRSVLGLTIDLASFLFFPNVGALVAHVDEQFGVEGEGGENPALALKKLSISSNASDSGIEADLPTPPERQEPLHPVVSEVPQKTTEIPTIVSAYDAFQSTRFGYDIRGAETRALNFWPTVYPDQKRLVLAYVVEAYAALGCDIRSLRPGEAVPEITALPRHKQLVEQLYRVLEDGQLISKASSGFVRTSTPVDPTSAEDIYQNIINLYPEQATVHKLVRAVGSKMAQCLTGAQDGLQIVFGDKETKRTLEEMYEFSPLLRTPTLLLGDFVLKAFSNSTGGGPFRILEIGAGTGGTTRYIVNHLRQHNIPFEYTFTDISSSLVGAARRQFKGIDGMSFELLDIEQPPKPEYENAFHLILATNCIHATRNLNTSLSHLRKMLRPDGALTLVEITQNMFWLDIVVGLFEGWWLFEDGRSHALVSEKHWEKVMKAAGFKEVLWTDGAAPEAKTVRVIGAFPSTPETSLPVVAKTSTKKNVKAALETVVYKWIGDLEIHADVYYPVDQELPPVKRPIALMIHGGSHVIFSRKDIRPAQTRLLLEMGFIPVSLDHRLCPEVSLSEGPMVDVCDALAWARNTLPTLPLQRSGLEIDGDRVVVVGWSSGGQLAMSLAWTAPQRGIRPPEAILAFYCPTNYEDEWWRHPIQPVGAEDKGEKYDVLDVIQDEPVTNYGVVGAWAPLSDSRISTDPRCRIVLHINWKAQTLPIIAGGLPSKKKATPGVDYNALPQPSTEQIVRISPRAQIVRGNYKTPTFIIHGTCDELIPWQQSQGTYDALVEQGVKAELALVEGAPHITDLSSDPDSEGWKAVLRGYDFIAGYAL